MSARARYCRLKQCLPRRRGCSVDRSNPGGCPNRVLSREAMSTGAMFWRQGQRFVKSHVVPIEAILEVVRVDKGKMLSTEAMSTGAMFCRQEPCCGDSNPGGCPYRQRQDVWAAWELGAPVWAACELVWTAWGPSDMATRRCFVDKSNVDRSKVLLTGALFYGQSHSWRPLRQLGRPEKLVWAA